jgi:hypothetical protein
MKIYHQLYNFSFFIQTCFNDILLKQKFFYESVHISRAGIAHKLLGRGS